jgi:hypothetical protein
MRNRILAIGILASIGTTTARSDELSAGDLYDYCRADHPVGQMACKLYLRGAVDGLKMAAEALGDTQMFCIPDLSDKQLSALFVANGQNDFLVFPADKNEPAISMVAALMAEHFKCGEAK